MSGRKLIKNRHRYNSNASIGNKETSKQIMRTSQIIRLHQNEIASKTDVT